MSEYTGLEEEICGRTDRENMTFTVGVPFVFVERGTHRTDIGDIIKL